MSQGREIGCKTLGCGAGILTVLFCFNAMITETEKFAEQVKTERATRAALTVTQNLQAVGIAVALYEDATGHLPPTTSPDDFKNALSPKFLSDAGVLVDGTSGRPFLPNPAVSLKRRKQIKTPGDVFLLASEPSAKGTRTVLMVSGEVKGVDAAAWKSLTAPRMPQPAGTSVPGASPAPSPR